MNDARQISIRLSGADTDYVRLTSHACVADGDVVAADRQVCARPFAEGNVVGPCRVVLERLPAEGRVVAAVRVCEKRLIARGGVVVRDGAVGQSISTRRGVLIAARVGIERVEPIAVFVRPVVFKLNAPLPTATLLYPVMVKLPSPLPANTLLVPHVCSSGLPFCEMTPEEGPVVTGRLTPAAIIAYPTAAIR